MKRFLIRALALTLLVLLPLLAVACEEKPSVEEESTTEQVAYEAAEDVQVIGFLKEDDFPKNIDFTEWLESALDSVQIDYAILVVQESDLYRCYLFSAVRGEDDAVRVGKRAEDGVLILQPDEPTEAEQGKGKQELFCFTVSSASAPQMEVVINGDSKGVRITRVVG